MLRVQNMARMARAVEGRVGGLCRPSIARARALAALSILQSTCLGEAAASPLLTAPVRAFGAKAVGAPAMSKEDITKLRNIGTSSHAGDGRYRAGMCVTRCILSAPGALRARSSPTGPCFAHG